MRGRVWSDLEFVCNVLDGRCRVALLEFQKEGDGNQTFRGPTTETILVDDAGKTSFGPFSFAGRHGKQVVELFDQQKGVAAGRLDVEKFPKFFIVQPEFSFSNQAGGHKGLERLFALKASARHESKHGGQDLGFFDGFDGLGRVFFHEELGVPSNPGGQLQPRAKLIHPDIDQVQNTFGVVVHGDSLLPTFEASLTMPVGVSFACLLPVGGSSVITKGPDTGRQRQGVGAEVAATVRGGEGIDAAEILLNDARTLGTDGFPPTRIHANVGGVVTIWTVDFFQVVHDRIYETAGFRRQQC